MTDQDTEQALRWQVNLWSELGSLMDVAHMDAVEFGLLRGIVLPAVYRYVKKYTGSTFIGKWWNQHTPEVVRTLLRVPKNLLLYVLDHPWATWLAMWIAKVLRMLWCINLFGVPKEELVRVQTRVLQMMDPRYQVPLIKAIVEWIVGGISCITDFASRKQGDPEEPP